jgi:hypothetical protein
MDNNTQPPQDPNQVDNSQNEYQKILDKYAQELASIESTDSQPQVPPQMPLQSTETPVINSPAAPPANPEPIPVVNMPISSQETEPETAPVVDMPTFPTVDEVLSPVTTPPITQEPDISSTIPETVVAQPAPPIPDVSAPESVANYSPLPTIDTPPVSVPQETHPIPPKIPSDFSTDFSLPRNPITIETPMPVENTSSAQPEIPEFENPPIQNEDKKPSPITKYFFIISLLIFLATAFGVGYTFFRSQGLKKSLEVNPPGGHQSSEVESNATCVLTDDQKYSANETFAAADGCNTCTCLENGTITCTENTCDGTTKGGVENDSTSNTESTLKIDLETILSEQKVEASISDAKLAWIMNGTETQLSGYTFSVDIQMSKTKILSLKKAILDKFTLKLSQDNPGGESLASVENYESTIIACTFTSNEERLSITCANK